MALEESHGLKIDNKALTVQLAREAVGQGLPIHPLITTQNFHKICVKDPNPLNDADLEERAKLLLSHKEVYVKPMYESSGRGVLKVVLLNEDLIRIFFADNGCNFAIKLEGFGKVVKKATNPEFSILVT